MIRSLLIELAYEALFVAYKSAPDLDAAIAFLSAVKYSDEQPWDEQGRFAGDGGTEIQKAQSKVEEIQGRIMDNFVPSRQPRLPEEKKANRAMTEQLTKHPATRISELEQVGLLAAGANTSLGVSRQARSYIAQSAREMGRWAVDVNRNPRARELMEANDKMRQIQETKTNPIPAGDGTDPGGELRELPARRVDDLPLELGIKE